VLSARKLARQVFRSSWYEAEDVLLSSTAAELVTAERPASPGLTKVQWKIKRLLTRDRERRMTLVEPGTAPIQLSGQYDLMVLLCALPGDALLANALDLERHAKVSVCWLTELWSHSIPGYQSWLPLLRKFDHVFVGQSASVQPASEAIGKACHYLPAAVDVLRFTPTRISGTRSIDVFSVGRRKEAVHAALLELAASEGLFYIHDTISNAANTTVQNYRDHRALLANIAKRSRFFTVAPAYFSDPGRTGGQVEIGPRFYEGAAAGAVLLGEPVDCEAYRRFFDWPDATIAVKPDGSDVGSVLRRLTSDPERMQTIRRRNVAETALRHDWVYRWKEILQLAGVALPAGVTRRESRLHDIAMAACPALERDRVRHASEDSPLTDISLGD